MSAFRNYCQLQSQIYNYSVSDEQAGGGSPQQNDIEWMILAAMRYIGGGGTSSGERFGGLQFSPIQPPANASKYMEIIDAIYRGSESNANAPNYPNPATITPDDIERIVAQEQRALTNVIQFVSQTINNNTEISDKLWQRPLNTVTAAYRIQSGQQNQYKSLFMICDEFSCTTITLITDFAQQRLLRQLMVQRIMNVMREKKAKQRELKYLIKQVADKNWYHFKKSKLIEEYKDDTEFEKLIQKEPTIWDTFKYVAEEQQKEYDQLALAASSSPATSKLDQHLQLGRRIFLRVYLQYMLELYGIIHNEEAFLLDNNTSGDEYQQHLMLKDQYKRQLRLLVETLINAFYMVAQNEPQPLPFTSVEACDRSSKFAIHRLGRYLLLTSTAQDFSMLMEFFHKNPLMYNEFYDNLRTEDQQALMDAHMTLPPPVRGATESQKRVKYDTAPAGLTPLSPYFPPNPRPALGFMCNHVYRRENFPKEKWAKNTKNDPLLKQINDNAYFHPVSTVDEEDWHWTGASDNDQRGWLRDKVTLKVDMSGFIWEKIESNFLKLNFAKRDNMDEWHYTEAERIVNATLQ